MTVPRSSPHSPPSTSFCLACAITPGGAEWFTRSALKALFADGLARIAPQHITIAICAAEADAVEIRQNADFARLSERFPVLFLPDGLEGDAQVLAHCANRHILINLPIGTVCCHGFLDALFATAKTDIRAVLAPEISTSSMPSLEGGVSPRVAAQFALDHLHPRMMDSAEIHCRHYEDVLLIHTLSPLLIYLDLRNTDPAALAHAPALGVDLLQTLLVPWSQIKLVSDSDEILLLHPLATTASPRSEQQAEQELRCRLFLPDTSPLRRWCLLHPYRLHAKDFTIAAAEAARENQKAIYHLAKTHLLSAPPRDIPEGLSFDALLKNQIEFSEKQLSGRLAAKLLMQAAIKNLRKKMRSLKS